MSTLRLRSMGVSVHNDGQVLDVFEVIKRPALSIAQLQALMEAAPDLLEALELAVAIKPSLQKERRIMSIISEAKGV